MLTLYHEIPVVNRLKGLTNTPGCWDSHVFSFVRPVLNESYGDFVAFADGSLPR